MLVGEMLKPLDHGLAQARGIDVPVCVAVHAPGARTTFIRSMLRFEGFSISVGLGQPKVRVFAESEEELDAHLALPRVALFILDWVLNEVRGWK
jgi:hypothetical protein